MKNITPFHIIEAAEKLLDQGVEVSPSTRFVVVTLTLDLAGVNDVYLRQGTLEEARPGHFLNDRSVLARFDSDRGGKVQ